MFSAGPFVPHPSEELGEQLIPAGDPGPDDAASTASETGSASGTGDAAVTPASGDGSEQSQTPRPSEGY